MDSWISTATFYGTVIPILALIFTYVWIRNHYRFKDLPPGPRGLPLVGNLLQLGPEGWKTLAEMSEKYGGIFTVTLGSQRAVVLNDFEVVREAFVDQGEVFSGRPPIFVFDYQIQNRDIASSVGNVWKEQRKFMIQNVKSFGFGKSSSESLIMSSVQMVMDDIDACRGNPLSFQFLFVLPAINIIWKYSANHILPKSSTSAKHFCNMMQQSSEGFGNQLINFLPLLRFVPGGFGFWKQQRTIARSWKFFSNEIEAHRKSFTAGQHRDLIDAYLQEVENRKGTPEEGKPPFNDEHMTGTLYDLFMAGSDTSSNTLLWGFLLLALHPEVQHKVQAEMDNVIGRGRLPCYADVIRLPYLEAMIQEVHRFVSLVPLSMFHAPMRDTTLRGYKIPRGTIIIQNIYAIHHDSNLWNDAENFRPERFLDNNNKVIKPPFLLPFSLGPRQCPGEPMARMELHLFFGCLLHKYKFARLPSEAALSLEPVIGLSLTPKPYSLRVTPR